MSNMIQPIKAEYELLVPLIEWLTARRQIRAESILVAELPWNGRRVDLAVLNSSGVCSAFELKLSHNQRAIEQSYLNGVSFDRSYLVTGTRPNLRNMESAVALGLGVVHISLDRGAVTLLHSAPRSRIHPIVRRRLREAIEMRGGSTDV
jgi:hypothetical protein